MNDGGGVIPTAPRRVEIVASTVASERVSVIDRRSFEMDLII